MGSRQIAIACSGNTYSYTVDTVYTNKDRVYTYPCFVILSWGIICTHAHAYIHTLLLSLSLSRVHGATLVHFLPHSLSRSRVLSGLLALSRACRVSLLFFSIIFLSLPLSLPPPSPSPLTHHFLSHTYLPIRTQVHNAADMSKGWKVLLTVESAQMMTEQAVNPYILCTLEAKGKGSRVEVSRKTSAGTHHTQVQHTYNTHKARIQQIHNTPHTIHTNTRTHALAWCIQIHPCLQTVEM